MGLFSRAPSSIKQEISFLGIEGQLATERCIFTAGTRGTDMQICYASDAPDVDHTTDYQFLSPFERVPSLRHGDFAIAGARGIIAYLDARGVGLPLTPRKARLVGQQNYWIELAGNLLAPIIQAAEVCENDSEKSVQISGYHQAENFIHKLNTIVEESEFILGSPTLADPQVCAYIKRLQSRNMLPQECDAIHKWYDRVFGLIPNELRIKYSAYFTLEKARKVA